MCDKEIQSIPIDTDTQKSVDLMTKNFDNGKNVLEGYEPSFVTSTDEDDGSEWTTVSRRKSKRRGFISMSPLPAKLASDDFLLDEDTCLNEKELRKQQFGSSKRRNQKESKIREFKASLLSGVKKTPPSVEKQKEELMKRIHSNSPHGEKEEENESGKEPEDMKDESFWTSLSQMSEYVKGLSGEGADDAIRHAENALILAYQLYRSRALGDVVAAISAYIKFYHKSSFIGTMSSLVDEIMKDATPEELDPQGMREALDCWELLKANTAFDKISYLVTAAFSISTCKMKDVEWSMEGVKLIRDESKQQMFKSKDIIDSVVHSFSWMAETGVWCFQERSLAPILFSDVRMHKYTQDVNYLLAHAQEAKHGDLDLNEYERKLDETIRNSGKMQLASKSPAMKELLQKKYASLVLIKQDVIAKRKNTTIRFAPFGISIFGESSIGKSNITELVMKTALTAMGFSDDPAGIITLKEGAKHDDTYTNDVEGVIIDDAAQQTPQYVQESPARKYITMFNSVAAQVVKAELNDKGCVFFNFKVGVITTNKKDLDAKIYSNYPVAVLRRFFHVTAEVKPKYRIPGGDSLDTDHPELVNHANPYEILDVWQFGIEKVFPSAGTPVWQTLRLPIGEKDREVYCKELPLRSFLDAVIYLAKKHKRKQELEVVKSKCLASIKCCKKCNRLPQYCECTDIPVTEPEPQGIAEEIGESVYMGVRKGVYNSIQRWLAPLSFFYWLHKLDFHKMVTKDLRLFVESQANYAAPMCVALVPEFVHQSSTFQNFLDLWHTHAHQYNMRRFQSILHFLVAACTCFSFFLQSLGFLLVSWVIYLVFMLTSHIEYRRQIEKSKAIYAKRRDALDEYSKSLRDGWVGKSVVAFLGIAVVVMAVRFWNNKRKVESSKPQAASDVPDIKAEDAKPGWMTAFIDKLWLKVESPETKTMVPQELISSVTNNCCWGSFFTQGDGRSLGCGVFFPRKSVMWFPKHMTYPNLDMTLPQVKCFEVKIFRHDKPGGVFKIRVNVDLCYSFPDIDMYGVYVPNSPDFKTVKGLPESLPKGSCMGHMIVSSKDTEKKVAPLSPKFGYSGHKFMQKMYGATYRSEHAVSGSCMSPIISESKSPCIVGFHIGGNNQTHEGVAMTITSQMAKTCNAWLEEHAGFLSAEATNLPHAQYDIPLITSTEAHPKAIHIQQLPKEAFVDVIGSTKVRSEQTTQVQPSIIAEDVKEVCGVTKEYGGPKLKPNWKAFNTNIDYFSNPSDMFDPALLKKAQKDYEEPLLRAMDEYKKVEDIRPLTMEETIRGIDGKKYIDPMPMSTGMGFPLFGKKNKRAESGEQLHFTEERLGELLVSRAPKDHVLEEFNRMEACWKMNERGYPVTSATLKDEPTPLTSEKVRVFQAAPVALGMHIRKYFLPIARFLHMHPELAESAVGVNAFSHDWSKLKRHTEKFATDGKMLAWDYSKYDVRMNSQLVRAAWETMIRLAERAGYSEEDLRIMRAMVVDIAHPLMDINGTMLRVYNMNTSGNNMTVDVNGIVGCFLVRMGFFFVYPKLTNFRKYVSALTYGDDFAGSCDKSVRKFNFVTYKDFLAQHGMKITLPSKTDDVVEFMDKEEVDFLKRKHHYIEEIGEWVGQLDENSIFKSLLANLKSPVATPREVAASCIETALHEWFAFGRDHYNMRKSQMETIAQKHQLSIPALNVSFDERVRLWKVKYDGLEA